jgi:heme exporter protein D
LSLAGPVTGSHEGILGPSRAFESIAGNALRGFWRPPAESRSFPVGQLGLRLAVADAGCATAQRYFAEATGGAKLSDFRSYMSLEQFLSMGGYAFYVWTSYAMVMAILIFNVILPIRRRKEVEKSIARLLKQGGGRQ